MRIGFGGAIFVSAFASLASGCATLPSVGATAVSASQCYTEYPENRPLVSAGNAQSAADVCGGASHSEGRPVRDIVNAMYHAGVGERLLAEKLNEQGGAIDESARRLNEAERYLQQALALRGDRQDVRLALAWVHYDQRRYPDALGEIATVLREQDNPTNWTHASAHYLRGLVLADSGDAVSALTDWEVLTSDALDRHAYAIAARRRIVSVATRLGIAAVNSGTRETVQNAIALFERAQSAAESSADQNGSWGAMAFPIAVSPAVDWPSEFERVSSVEAADVLTNLGRARLQLAGLTGRAGTADFKCGVDDATPELLNLARQDFDSALLRAVPGSASAAAANRGKTCALLALNRTSEAVAAALATVPGDSPLRQDWRNWRMLGRAQARLVTTDQQHQTAADSLIAASTLLSGASTGFVGDRRAELADIYVETADMYFNPRTDDTYFQDYQDPDVDLARNYLCDAILELMRPRPCQADQLTGSEGSAGARFANAFVKRGRILFYQGNFSGARADFVGARLLTNDMGDRFSSVRAEALYYLSRLATDRDNSGEAESAISMADAAFALVPLPLYRQQACLSRIHFRRVAAADQNYCAAANAGTPDAGAHLFEGLYELRRAHIANSEGARHRAWESAYRAFETGLRVLDSTGSTADQRELRARLLLGRATAQSCVGFAQIGTDMENAIAAQVGQDMKDRAHAFFERHRVMTCDGQPTHSH
ncbi:MAG: tetratricopeptide repeat protein [Hyphomonadaceae bacterium]|nr:tetratricopeptide repeat protein [Hyphomonadaceae bacterium]